MTTRPKLTMLKPRLTTLNTNRVQPLPATAGRVQRERGATNQRTRERYFRLHPLCVMCEREDRVTIATELDHIVALVNGGTNADSNRQGLCTEHHKAKTAQDVGKSYTPRRPVGNDGWPT